MPYSLSKFSRIHFPIAAIRIRDYYSSMQPEDKKTISVHRAFVYGAFAPGLGEIYAGSRLRGFLTAASFISFGTWFFWVLFRTMKAITDSVFDSLNTATQFDLPALPYVSLGISFLGIYFIWLWAMISAVDVAVVNRRKIAEPPQVNAGWAVAISWFCPGSGQVYDGSRRFGYILFAGYLIGILLIIPAYKHIFQNFSELAKSEQLSPNNPYVIIDLVHGLLVKLNYSFGKLFQIGIKSFAIASSVAALRQGPLKNDEHWCRPSIGYSMALLGIGWLCPGAGQLLQKRNKIGWYLLASYIGSKVLISILLSHDFITVQKTDSLAWVSVLIQWGAMIEALIWTRLSYGKNR